MTTKSKRQQFLMQQIIKQRRWIDQCEASALSYTDGQRGLDIKAADMSQLRLLERELERLNS